MKLYKKKKTTTDDARNLHSWPNVGVKGSLRSRCDMDNLNFKSSTLQKLINLHLLNQLIYCIL